jgi:hypothetical protein
MCTIRVIILVPVASSEIHSSRWPLSRQNDQDLPLREGLLPWWEPAFLRHLKGGRVVFNIAGNKYRLVVWINYPYRVVYVRFIGSHKAYDKIDAETI